MIRTRFAPSPTGKLHVGGLRTALYSWAYARHFGGEFVLRVEDTDTERNNLDAANGIIESMAWAGLQWDKGPIYQSDRTQRYTEFVNDMVQKGLAYYSNDMNPHDPKKGFYRGPERDLGLKTPPEGSYVIRARIPFDIPIQYDDMVKGPVSTTSNSVEDWVLVRSNGMPTYNLAVVVDDLDMEISHVIRGDDHVNNTPKQWLVYKLLGHPIPIFGHIPMILDSKGKKLSKRTIDEVAATQEFPVDVPGARNQGLCPSALLNYLARLGWSKDNMEVFSMDEFIKVFDGTGMQTSAARVDPAKLHWLNVQHLKKLSQDDLYTWSLQQPNVVDSPLYKANFSKFANLCRQRSDKTTSFRQDFEFISSFLNESGLLAPKATGFTSQMKLAWSDLYSALASSIWTAELIDLSLRSAAERSGLKFGDFAQNVRQMLSDKKVTPPIPMMLMALGKDRSLDYFEQVLGQDSSTSPKYI